MTQTFKMANGDVVIDRTVGRFVMVRDRDKLRQDVREDLTIETQAATGFGAGLEDLLGQDVDPAAFRMEIARRIRGSVLTLQALQNQYLSAQRSSSERIDGISRLLVVPADLGGGPSKTGYAFQLAVRPGSGEAVTVSGVVPTGT